MYAFKYERPTALADAQKSAQAGGQVLAGGQTMIAAMKQRLQQPETLVDLAAISGLAGIKKDGNNIVIGAMTRHQDVADNADVQKNIPGLALLANNIGDKQVRAMGTIGGSVANNDPAACYPSALLALGATIQTDKRTIKADDFFLGMYATALDAGEIITSVSFPIPSKSAMPSSTNLPRALRWWACLWRKPLVVPVWPLQVLAMACSAMLAWKPL